MFVLVTGQPGAGKTSHLLRVVLERAEKEQRRVFYWNIRGLKPLPGWSELESAGVWFEHVEDGAIVIMDEVQEAFPPARPGSPVPEAVALLAKHRHRGLDFYVTTQSPVQTHSQMRAIAGEHWHVVRLTAKRYVVNKYPKVVNVNDRRDQQLRKSAEHHRYDPTIFERFESTVLDTHKPKMPKKLLLVPVGLIAVVVLFMTAVNIMGGQEAVQGSGDNAEQVQEARTSGIGSRQQYSFAERWQPRIPSIPWSAPAYDSVANVQSLPKVHCVSSATKCQCYTQQATRIQVGSRECRYMAKVGTFDPFRDERRDENERDKSEISRKSHDSIRSVNRNSETGEAGKAAEAATGPPQPSSGQPAEIPSITVRGSSVFGQPNG